MGSVRFIPAGAGNGSFPLTTTPKPPVHPRGCGERSWNWAGSSTIYGSSPRVRGTDQQCSSTGEERRFIPAGAGNGHRPHDQAPIATVHPRGCGERTAFSSSPVQWNGSSPRVRGTECGLADKISRRRFIPAGAGNGGENGRRPTGIAVHPRGCGERTRGTKETESLFGSSPRVRGTVC